MATEIVLGSAIRQNLAAVDRAQKAVDGTSARISTGRRINSALDQPQSFFTASSLTNRASDFSRLIDNINLSTRTIEETLQGVQALSRLLNQAETIALESQKKLNLRQTDPAVEEQTIDLTPQPLSLQILAANPVAYYRLNDNGGGVAVNQGSGGATLDGTYENGAANNAAQLYSNAADVSTDFDGIDDHVTISNDPLLNTAAHPERTIELVFNADTTAGRQVLYEEGGNFNAINMYIESGRLHYNVAEVNEYGPFNLSIPIDAGETYHATMVYDGPNNEFRAYLNGELVDTRVVNDELAIHTGGIGIGSLNGRSVMHDGQSPLDDFRFDGRISDVAIYNDALSDFEIFSHAESLDSSFITQFINTEFEKVISQIDALTQDTSVLGVNLLGGDNLVTEFNDSRSNSLTTRGVDFSFEGLGIENINFNDGDQLQDIIDSVRNAIQDVRDYGNTLSNDINIMSTRVDFTRGLINNHLAGADDLTAADVTAEGTKQLAASTRLQISQSTLASLSQSQASVLQLFNSSIFG